MIALEQPAARTGPWVPAVLASLAAVVVLLARPWLVRGAASPTAVLVLAFVAIGVAGARLALPAGAAGSRPQPLPTAAVVAAVGVAAFAIGRLVGGGEAPVPAVAGYLALNTLAAVSEEALFRRLLYGLLLPHGAFVAVVGSAAAFAVVHVTVWGVWVLPLDLAAGLVLSWQRWASGRWSVPAVTHAVANAVVLL